MIDLQNISKKFDGVTAVDNLSLMIKKGEIVGLLGPNGAGKTTTLRIISGVLPPTKGKVIIDEKEMSLEEMVLKREIGYLPENNPLYPDLTVEEFLKFWLEIKSVPADSQKDALDFVVKNTKIADVYFRPINELSKGYRQRVGLAQAILTKPKILILDEPTEGLDPNQRQDIQRLIAKLGKDRTVIIASHVLSEISRVANRIIIINKGKLVADGKPSELVDLPKNNIRVEAEIEGQGILTALRSLTGVIRVEKESKNYYILTTRPGTDHRREIFNLAKRKNWTLLTMFVKKAALEDIFSILTKDE